jgi:hypothetical protein
MTPKLQEIVDLLERSRAELMSVAGRLTQAELDRTPAPGRWSPGEVLDHVYRAERGVAKLVAIRIPAALEAGLPPDPSPTESVVGLFRDSRVIDRRNPIPAPDFVLPKSGRSRDELFGALEETRRDLIAGLEPAADRDLTAIAHPHPVLGPIDLYQWLLFCYHHERRHTDQIREAIAQIPETPPA